jgi:hypothetical protein
MSTESKRDLFTITMFAIAFLLFYKLGEVTEGYLSIFFYIMTGSCGFAMILISQIMSNRNKKQSELISLKQNNRDLQKDQNNLEEIIEFLKTPQAKNLFKDNYKEIISDINFHAKQIKELMESQTIEILDKYDEIKKLST